MALKFSRAATGRHKTISFWDAFHGAGFGAASVGGEQLFRSHVIGPLLSGTEHVAPFACYRCPYGYPHLNGEAQLEICQTTRAISCAMYWKRKEMWLQLLPNRRGCSLYTATRILANGAAGLQ
ncbi:MAG: hypothetical protein Ct9H300mP21_00390 [Pseudomonadota bacterium]|nr:MAG: hypothetical protein Ct9H300mP21_00390 [Pseudomonadota bacterium]